MPASAHIDWAAVDAVVKATSLPVIVKGITTSGKTRRKPSPTAPRAWWCRTIAAAMRRRSRARCSWSRRSFRPLAIRYRCWSTAVSAAAPTFSRPSAFGAKGVLIGRPVMWGLAAYGADGVQGVVEMLQTELARYMGMCGRPSLAAINSSLVRVHAPLPTVREQSWLISSDAWLTNPSRRNGDGPHGGACGGLAHCRGRGADRSQAPQRASPRLEPGRDADGLRLRAASSSAMCPCRSMTIRRMATGRSSRSGAIARPMIGSTSCRRARPSRHRRSIFRPSCWA